MIDLKPIHIGDSLLERLKKVQIESAWGALRDLGYFNSFISSLTLFVAPEPKMVGRAMTLRYLPRRLDLDEMLKEEAERKGYSPALNTRAVNETKPGDVWVVDIGGQIDGAGFIGDIVMAGFKLRGGRGVVVDGAVRDLSVLKTMGIPVYARGVTAHGSGNIVGVDMNVPVRCGGVAVLPGDVIVGDLEGVLVIPAHLAEGVVERAEATDDREAFLRKKVEEGKLPMHHIYPPNQEVLREYEEYKKRGRNV